MFSHLSRNSLNEGVKPLLNKSIGEASSKVRSLHCPWHWRALKPVFSEGSMVTPCMVGHCFWTGCCIVLKWPQTQFVPHEGCLLKGLSLREISVYKSHVQNYCCAKTSSGFSGRSKACCLVSPTRTNMSTFVLIAVLCRRKCLSTQCTACGHSLGPLHHRDRAGSCEHHSDHMLRSVPPSHHAVHCQVIIKVSFSCVIVAGVSSSRTMAPWRGLSVQTDRELCWRECKFLVVASPMSYRS
jgi:hypothetical protein